VNGPNQLQLLSQEPPRKRERDITANRHMGNPQSEAAHQNYEQLHSSARAEVYWFFASNPGTQGRSAQDASKALGWPINRISPRISELKRDKWLVQAGIGVTDTNSACALYVALSASERGKLLSQS